MTQRRSSTQKVLGGAAAWELPASNLMWLDLSDLTTVFQDAAMTTPVSADGQTIRAIADKGPSGNDMIRFSDSYVGTYKAAMQALNNPKYYRTNTGHIPGSTSEFTYIMVASMYSSATTNGASGNVMEGGLHTQRTCLSFYKHAALGLLTQLHHNGTSNPRALFASGPADYDTHFLIIVDGVDSTAVRMWFNNDSAQSHTDFAAPYDGGWSSNAYMRLGGTANTYLDVCECMHWNRKLTDAERNATKAHLLSKWGIS